MSLRKKKIRVFFFSFFIYLYVAPFLLQRAHSCPKRMITGAHTAKKHIFRARLLFFLSVFILSKKEVQGPVSLAVTVKGPPACNNERWLQGKMAPMYLKNFFLLHKVPERTTTPLHLF
jgi:hypothetical protein